MNQLIDFASGPLFRLTFAIMTLGIIRMVFLSIINVHEARNKGNDKKIPMGYVKKLTWGFLLPIRAFRVKPVYSFISIIFHIGLILNPLFLFAHSLIFERSIGWSWIGLSLPKEFSGWLSGITIVFGLLLLLMRIGSKASRFLSRKQDIIILILLIIPSITGFICANVDLAPNTYKLFILVHIISAEAIFLAMPFTKIAHCILMPFSQLITARSWKFVPKVGEYVENVLGKEGRSL